MSTSTEQLTCKTAARQAVAVLRTHRHHGDGSTEVLAALAEGLRQQLATAPTEVQVETVAHMLITSHRAWTEYVDGLTEDLGRIGSDWEQVAKDLRKAISRVGGELRLEGVLG